MLGKIKNIFHPDSAATSAAKGLPNAYREMLGRQSMLCNDESQPDWLGMSGTVDLAKLENLDSETGRFSLLFSSVDENNSLMESFKSEMAVIEADRVLCFSAGSESVEVNLQPSLEDLRPVLEMARRNSTKLR